MQFRLTLQSILLFVSLCVIPPLSFAQSVDLSLVSIPDSLKLGSDAIVRNAVQEIVIINQNRALLKKELYITVLNANGRKYGHFIEIYDGSQKISKFSGALYDHRGNQVSRFRNRDLQDRSLISDFSLFEESRIKYLEIHRNQFPYTVRFEYEIEFDGYASFPRWVPQAYDKLAVQQSALIVRHPESLPIRHKTLNADKPNIKKFDSGAIQYSWQVSNVKAFQMEPLSPPAHEFLPMVLIAPENFVFHNTVGRLSSWNEYGQWVSTLLDGRQVLPESIISHVQSITEGLENNPRLAARIIYEYMQSQTRYVSIQLGIGGFQPLPASTVSNTGYGDCKALSNYTKALLRVAGIDSYYAEIGLGRQSIYFEDFPSLDQTNHAILFVPIEGDTIWMECTSQRLPFGHLPTSLQNRNALVVKGDQSTLLKTPGYDIDKNYINLTVNIDIADNGMAAANIAAIYSGSKIESTFPEVWQNRQEQENAIIKRYALPGSSLNSFSMALNDEFETLKTLEEATMQYSNFGALTGRRMFVPIFPYRESVKSYSPVQNRKTDFIIPLAYTTKAVFNYKLSENFQPEAIPENIEIKSQYGIYRISVELLDNTIRVTREYRLNSGRYPASEYTDFIGFHHSISMADRRQIVLIAN